MKSVRAQMKEGLLPLGVFAATVLLHYLWLGLSSGPVPEQSRWASLPGESPSWLSRYLESGGYWLSYSYGISLAFAAIALRRSFRNNASTGGRFALGGLTFSGLLVVGGCNLGCYLLGCCGSPMLVVYLNLFGAGFLPFAKPLLAAVATLSILGTWLWMIRIDRKREACCPSGPCKCG